VSDIFISYARATEAAAKRIAEALRDLGHSVWRDDELPAHRDYAEVIEERLRSAKAVVVVWSAESVKSQWVRAEADMAREAGALVQLSLDGSALPMPFNRIQCADLAGWSGDPAAPGWRKVADSVDALVRGTDRRATATTSAAPAAERRLAVLAFDNLSADPEMGFFSDGVSEEILETVSRNTDLQVISRASSFQFRGSAKATRHVAAELNVSHLLDGSVRRSGVKVRVAAQLVECATEARIWSERFDRDLDDVFALQDEIAAAVAEALKTTFARSQPPAPIDPAAYDLFLRAGNLFPTDSEIGLRRIRDLEEVVRRAPAFARGWATLAAMRATTLLFYRDAAAVAGVTPEQAAEAAETALRLDPHMGQAYQALANIEPWAAYAVRQALNDKALAAAPNDVGVLADAGRFHHTVGRVREALALVRRAHELDPLSSSAAIILSITLRAAGEMGEAQRVTEAALERWPDNLMIAANTILFGAQQGDQPRVETLIRAWSSAATENPTLRQMIRWAQIAMRPDAESLRTMLEEQRDELTRTGTVSLFEPLMLYRMGLADEAFELLDKASFAHLFRRDGTTPAGHIAPGAIFIPAHGLYRDRRFPRLCAKLGLADYWIQTDKWPDCAEEVPYDFRAEIGHTVSAEGP
jgi:TolB-like protein